MDINITEGQNLDSVGVVVIGRNEGDRLRLCLTSLVKQVSKIVYVDSGSTDNSLALAKQLDVEAVDLDLSIPFTAARARNTGFERLISLYPDLRYVQFVDGDCEVIEGWLHKAFSFLESQPDYAVVCGLRRERFPEKSIYNQLCDWEWNGAIGDIKACGGDALIRVKPFVDVAGYRNEVIAAEDDELCIRIRLAGWKVHRLAAEMTLHDADMMYFSQWWKRAVRAGYAFALGFYLYGLTPERHFVRETLRVWFWAGAVPVSLILSSLLISPWLLLLFAIYPLQVIKLSRRLHSTGLAVLLVLCHFPELYGQIKFILMRLSGKRDKLIEYK